MNLNEASFYLNWPLRSGLVLEMESLADWGVAAEIFINNEYEAALKCATIDPLKRKLRILDLGANMGYFSLYAADYCIRHGLDFDILAVEANPQCVREMFARFRRQPTNQLVGKIDIRHGLIGYRSGTNKLQLDPEFHAKTWVNDNGTVEVAYLDLDKIITPGEEIDIIKLDIEGSEAHFAYTYSDSLLKRTNVVIAELHHTICNTEVVFNEFLWAGLNHQECLHGDKSILTTDIFWK